MDLVPAVRGVLDPGPDDLDPRALLGDGDARAVLRNDLHDEVPADPRMAVREPLPVARVGTDLDVDVAVVFLELQLPDRPDRDAAAALHDQTLRSGRSGS